MQHSAASVVETTVGPLTVRRMGSGPPAILWHSMFVDSETFSPLVDELGRHRDLFLVDGPGHGSSPGPRRIYSLQDCAVAAIQILDGLQLDSPVDWVGNAWGGHVGILVAQGWPGRCRTLTMIGTPAYPLSTAQRRKTALLVALYRVLGPDRLSPLVVNALVGSEKATEEEIAAAESVDQSFRRGDRQGKYWAMRSLMLRRPDLRAVLESQQVPTLMMAGRDDPMNDAQEAARLASLMSRGGFKALPGGGHVAPLFVAADELTQSVLDFWETLQPPGR
ncbi:MULTISPECIES: alpha/beta hydrolase [Arthrobacter]